MFCKNISLCVPVDPTTFLYYFLFLRHFVLLFSISPLKSFQDTTMVFFSRHLPYLQSISKILKDYADTINSSRYILRAHPMICSGLTSALLLFLVLSYHCPDNDSFSNLIISNVNEISQISPKLRNFETEQKLFCLMRLNDEAKLCTFSFGPCRLAYMLRTSPNTNLYYLSYNLLNPSIISYDRLLDVGFMNTWWYIKRIMVDFDVNDIK